MNYASCLRQPDKPPAVLNFLCPRGIRHGWSICSRREKLKCLLTVLSNVSHCFCKTGIISFKSATVNQIRDLGLTVGSRLNFISYIFYTAYLRSKLEFVALILWPKIQTHFKSITKVASNPYKINGFFIFSDR